MSKKYAFLFPGQGAQTPGMVKDIAEKSPAANKIIEYASEVTNLDLKKLLWESDAETLARSDNSQIAITVASLAIVAALEEKGINPSCAMGFSLGEFPALCVSGVLSLEDTFKLVLKRGQIMQKVCEEIQAASNGNAPGMTAVLGLSADQVKSLTENIKDAYPANMNSSKQTVVSGTSEALEQVEKAASEAGARRAVRLKVAGPFHSPLMQKAADEFKLVLENIQFNDPKIHLYSNVTGKEILSGNEAKENAVLHLTHPVLWTDEEDSLCKTISLESDSEWNLLECGPGKVLTGLFSQFTSDEKLQVKPVNTAELLDQIQ